MDRFLLAGEPDLNDSLTAIAFLVDERVWDYEKYPEVPLRETTFKRDIDIERRIELNVKKYGPEFEKVIKLREFLSNYSLARN